MKISIITVCKNAGDVIEKTFLSIFNQTYKNIEYVIIDGASNDKTASIIEKYKDQISYFVSEPDSGIYNAMNKGIKAATGDILLFLNAGDSLYDENVFSHILNEFETNKEAELIFGDLFFTEAPTTINSDKIVLKPNRIGKYNRFLLNMSLYHIVPPHPASFFRREVFDKCGMFREDIKISSDYEFYLRILLKHRILFKYTERIVTNFALGGISSLKENSLTQLNEYKFALKDYPVLNKNNLRVYKFIVRVIYPLMMRNFKWLFRKYNNNLKSKEFVNKFISRFVGGHLNAIYDEGNTIAGNVINHL